MNLKNNIGLRLAGVWLILTGVIPIINLGFSGLNMIMALIALAAGILILIGR